MEKRPLVVLAVLTLLAFALVTLLRSISLLEGLELKTYDVYLRLTGDRHGPSEPVVMVEYTEEDEAAFGFPLPDDRLADLFDVLTAKGAVAIGLDLIRDRPEPQIEDRSAFDRLSRILRDHPSIIAITKDDTGTTFEPPPALSDRPLQVASATLLPDADGTIRRGLLHLEERNGETRPTLALLLAGRYLAANGVDIDWPAQGRLRLGDHEIRPFSPDDSGFYRQHGGLGGGYQILLNFPACETGFERHRIVDLLGSGADEIELDGRIVLVGNTVSAAKDVVDVSLNCAGMAGGKMFGLHLHGHIVSQLIGLSDNTLSPLESTEQRVGGPLTAAMIDGGWTWLWTTLGGIIALLLPSPLWLISGAAAGLLALAGAAFWLFSSGWWLPLIPPVLGFVLSLTLAITYVMTRARNEREDIMALFSGVVSKGVADAIWRRRDRDENEALQLMTATVMFTDIKGFTTISESLSEPVLADWLNDYMAVMVDIVARHGGVIEKFAGDGLTIEFGVPEPRETEAEIDADAKASVDCALAMAEALPVLNADWLARNLPAIGIRVGIHTGPLMVGVIGSADRWQYSIIGDTANTAARIEGYAKDDPDLGCDVGHCRILISAATFDRLGEDFVTENVGEASLKGKALTIGVHRVHGRRSNSGLDPWS